MSSNDYPAGEIEVRGTRYQVRVDDAGRWLAVYQDAMRASDTKEHLREQLLVLTKKAAAKVSVRFSRIDRKGGYSGGSLYNRIGTATGIHQANGNVLARWDGAGGKSEQITERYSSDYFVPPLTDDEAAEIIRLTEAVSEAQNALSAYRKGRVTRLDDAVTQAIQEAVDADQDGA
jgi:hypothetical protein